MTEADRSGFVDAIWEHWRARGRDLPWRRTSDPYAVMVSEFMLQQTQVSRVLGKFALWMDELPDVMSCAAASRADILTLWSGLGYNRRALMLHDACMECRDRFGGVVPGSVKDLESLKGIGPYTARAVSTFAFGNAEIFIETNIRRVFLFFFFQGREAVPDSEILEIVGATFQEDNPREWYWALMDYGSELARLVPNPNRRGKAYAKQSDFASSARKVRGAILKELVAKRGVAKEDLRAVCDSGYGHFDKVYDDLIREGFVSESGAAGSEYARLA